MERHHITYPSSWFPQIPPVLPACRIPSTSASKQRRRFNDLRSHLKDWRMGASNFRGNQKQLLEKYRRNVQIRPFKQLRSTMLTAVGVTSYCCTGCRWSTGTGVGFFIFRTQNAIYFIAVVEAEREMFIAQKRNQTKDQANLASHPNRADPAEMIA